MLQVGKSMWADPEAPLSLGPEFISSPLSWLFLLPLSPYWSTLLDTD